MSRVLLTGDAYVERSVISNAQETINLYAEENKDAQAPVPISYYLTPGTVKFAQANLAADQTILCRCTYRTSLGTAYVVFGGSVYQLLDNGALVFTGAIADNQSQVIMADNGLAVVIVDGTTSGYAIDISTNSFGPIVDPSFYGANFVVFLDTFFVFNRPATNQFYISLGMVTFALLTGGTSFDPLDIAAKSGSADIIVSILAVHKELVLVGQLTTEIWIGTGAADFYFQLVQGAYIEHGSIAAFSATNTDVVAFWVMQDKAGKNQIVQFSEYTMTDISTPYLVDQLNSYPTTADIIGFCFQLVDHAFYVMACPSGNVTWLYSLKNKKWFKWSWFNSDDGSFNRHRANCGMFVFGKNLIGDWANGKIYSLDANIFNDDGGQIVRVKTFAHMLDNDGYNRVVYNSFDADMEVGRASPDSVIEPLVSLSWSDDRGVSYGNPVAQGMGMTGQFLTTISWSRLGMARDRIFKLSWSEDIKTSLNGAFVTNRRART